MTTSTPTRLIDDLNTLHDSYVAAINNAIESGHEADTADLAAAYDGEATEMVAVREGRTDLLPLRVRGRRR